MGTRTKSFTVAIVFLLGIGGFCHQALAQTHSAMMTEATALSYESTCGSSECYEPTFQCCSDDYDPAFLSLRAYPSFKKYVFTPSFQSSPSHFQQYEVRRGFYGFLSPSSPPPSLTGIVVKKE